MVEINLTTNKILILKISIKVTSIKRYKVNSRYMYNDITTSI